MKKRLLSALLVLVIVLTMLPTMAFAAIFSKPGETAYWDNLSLSEATSILTSVSNRTASTDVVFVYYSLDCGYSKTYVPQFAEMAAKNKIKVCGYAYEGNSSGDGSALNAIWNFFSGSLGFPAVVRYDASTKTYQAVHSVRTLQAFQNLLGGESSTPDKDSSSSASGPNIPLIYDSAVSRESWAVLRLVNQHRMSMGLAPLSTFANLQMVANQRAYEIAYDYRSDHSRPDGAACFTAYGDYNVRYSTAAENIAAGYASPAAVMNGWLNSSGHRANIESSSSVHMSAGYKTRQDMPDKAAGQTEYYHYWTQNFAGAGCSFSNLSLSRTTVSSGRGGSLEDILTDANITVTATCSVHGTCTLPLIAAMCSGYQEGLAGTQTVTVTYGGRTAVLTIEAPCTDHVYDSGTVTVEATCTEDGVRTYTCTICGNQKTEAIPAAGHNFVGSEEEGYVCTVCGETIAADARESHRVVISDLLHGTATVSAASAKSGEQVTVSAIPDAGYEVKTIAVTGESGKAIQTVRAGGNTYIFTMPDEAVTVYITYKMSEVSQPAAFVDVPAGEYYAAPVAWAVENGITEGTGYRTFSPLDTCTRGQIVTFLWRAYGEPEPTTTGNPFTDVKPNDYYYKAVLWAVENGITTGTGAATFDPQGECTRGQAVTFLYRAAGEPAVSGGSGFADVPAGEYYADAVAWAVKKGITDGTSNTTFSPNTICNRAQIVTFLHRDLAA